MQIISPEFIKNKKVLLRLDIDVLLKETERGGWKVVEDFRLEAGLPTLELCLKHASRVIVMGHLGRPKGRDESLSVSPVADWLKEKLGDTGGKLDILENLRFDPREELEDEEFAKELSEMGDVFVNEAFASYRPSASTTILPKLLPHYAGLRFASEIETLKRIKENPQKPFVAIMGGAKVEEKMPVIEAMSKIADAVLVGGLLPKEIQQKNIQVKQNVLVGRLNDDGKDIAQETTESWQKIINEAKMIVWNGPLGFVEDPKNDESRKIAELVIASGAESIIGGGDTVVFLSKLGLLDKFSFVSTGGGAMLEFLAKGSLPTIEALV